VDVSVWEVFLVVGVFNMKLQAVTEEEYVLILVCAPSCLLVFSQPPDLLQRWFGWLCSKC